MNLAAAVEALGQGAVVSVEALVGGDLSEASLVTFEDGRNAVVKRGPPEQIEREALLLRHMRAMSDAPLPAILAVSAGLLLLEALPNDGRVAPAWRSIGEGLKTLHEATEPRYGFRFDYMLGPIAQPNGFSDDWLAFWRERRLLPLAKPLPSAMRKRVEGVASRLGDFVSAAPRPALLHGDCWTGNLLVADGQLTGFIDPACYYGDVEVDLAILTLFASPSDAFWEAYGVRDAGWPEREAVYQLWPLLVHVRLFGSSYMRRLESRLVRLGA